MALFPVFFNHRLIYKIYKMLFLFSSKNTKADFLINLLYSVVFLDNIFIFYSSCQYSTHVGVIYPAHSQKQSNYQTELFLIAHLSALF